MRRLRRVLRRFVPFAARWRLPLLLRHANDAFCRTRFAESRTRDEDFAPRLCRYSRPLSCYPGQEAAFEGKRRNIELALAAIDGVVIRPGETFSFWHCVGRPMVRRGYRHAAALKDGELTEDVGGALCLASTVLYNVALLGAMEITERRCHSVDSYGAARYFELGRDAAVEYAYTDLRFRNPLACPVELRAEVGENSVHASLQAPEPVDVHVRIEVDDPTFVDDGMMLVRTSRSVAIDGKERPVEVTWSRQRTPWG